MAALVVVGMTSEAQADAPGGAPPPASAPAPAPVADDAAQPAELARMRYRQGSQAYGAGRYRESIDYFLEADKLAPNAALSFNIALAYERIDDPAAALRWYRDYLRRAPDAKDRAEIEPLVHSLELRLAKKGVQQITLQSDPSGATILIDGHPMGVTPWTSEIPPGSHRLELRLDGHDSVAQSIELARDRAMELLLTLPVAHASPASPVAPAAPVAPAPSSPAQESISKLPLTTLGWVGVGVGGAALTGALVFELLRRTAESNAQKEATQIGYASDLDTMQGRQTAARLLTLTGAAFGIAGGVLLFAGSKSHDQGEQTAVTAGCVPGACWSTMRGRF